MTFVSTARYRGHVRDRADQIFGPLPEIFNSSSNGSNIQPSPLDAMDDTQRDKLREFRQLIDREWDVDALLCARDKKYGFLSDLTLYRYLAGFKWDISQCAPLLKKACQWRKEHKPWLVRFEDFSDIVVQQQQQHVAWHQGYTLSGRPVMYLRIAADKTDNSDPVIREKKWKMFLWVHELLCARMPENVYQIFWIVDLKDASLSIPLVSSMKDMFIELGEYYVEAMHRLYTINTHWTLSLVWNFLKPFLTPATVAKYDIRRPMSDTDLNNLLTTEVRQDVLSDVFTGSNTYRLNVDEIIEWDRERLRQLEEEERELERGTTSNDVQ